MSSATVFGSIGTEITLGRNHSLLKTVLRLARLL
jgi:hypothetical protein